MSTRIVDVSRWDSEGPEQLGSSEKLWLVDENEQRWLWKAAGFNNDHRDGRFRKGDDWAEWLGTQVAEMIGLPAAQVQLAEREGAAGTIGRSFVERDKQQLVLGNVMLYEVDASYPKEATGSLTEYTVDAVLDVLTDSQAPDGFETWTAPQVMTGYLMLDALIANIDRHHENWGVVMDVEGNRQLAPTFDHGSSLGFLLSDDARQRHLDTNDQNQTPEMWASRARSRFGRQHPVDVFNLAARRERRAAEVWKTGLEQISTGAIEELLEAVPAGRMSKPSQIFAKRIIGENRRQLLSHPPARVES